MKYSKEDVSKILTYYEYWRGHPDMTIEKAIDDYNPIESPTSTDTGHGIEDILSDYKIAEWGVGEDKSKLVAEHVFIDEKEIPEFINKITQHSTPPTAHTEELSRDARSFDKELIQFLISSDKPFKIIEVRNIINEYDREEISLSRFAEKLNEIAFYWNKNLKS